MGRKKIFRGVIKEQRYRVPDYSIAGLEHEFRKVRQDFNSRMSELLELAEQAKTYTIKSFLVQKLEGFDAWRQTDIKDAIEKIRSERTMDLKQWKALYSWHRPISDPYIQQQFFLASKECCELELENLRAKINSLFDFHIKDAKRLLLEEESSS